MVCCLCCEMREVESCHVEGSSKIAQTDGFVLVDESQLLYTKRSKSRFYCIFQ